ncbi:uncharacterized protein LOC5508973 [Nematostella vectensis]|uniref:uncharacterized protein LOC5508973 n=1 Tax=Nematostella vectensis TaxID=45351 RepID=UPI00207734CE|nr:uncharacterized protein LOC5508973 [Nematostella vectensis]
MVPAFKCTLHLPNTMFVFAVIIYLAIDVSRATLLPSNSSKYHLEATNSRNCINIYLAACDPSDSCTVEFTQMKQKTDGSNDILKEDAIKPVTTADNSSYVFCIYDPVVSINASCCKYPVSGRNGSLSLKYGFISFMSKTCVTGSGNCVIRDSRKYVLPLSHDVCLSLTPCRNGGTCHATGGFLYTCACPGGLKGERCDEPVGYEKIGYICLATNESLANVKNKTVSECASLCDNTKSCSSFEFATPSSPDDRGKCVLRSYDQSAVTKLNCGSAYFQKEHERPKSAVTMTTVPKMILVLSITVLRPIL